MKNTFYNHINALREAGIEVEIEHERPVNEDTEEVEVKGGRTVVRLKNDWEGVGVARCSPVDNFCRHTGIQVAFRNALANIRKAGFVRRQDLVDIFQGVTS